MNRYDTQRHSKSRVDLQIKAQQWLTDMSAVVDSNEIHLLKYIFEYLYFTWVFAFMDTYYFHSTTFQRQIFYV